MDDSIFLLAQEMTHFFDAISMLVESFHGEAPACLHEACARSFHIAFAR
ncbi:hypothetical protein PQR62_19255 [Herbaspirillum lusitanum]|uniref:Uncharacterized protein n=1 Tax=Herbaspirillum lusitanum TaxID=213312 RepID=A0ABW9AC28_9BURK